MVYLLYVEADDLGTSKFGKKDLSISAENSKSWWLGPVAGLLGQPQLTCDGVLSLS